MDISEFRLLLELAREYGVLQMKYKDMEVTLGPISSSNQPSIVSGYIAPANVEIANEDMLYWSVSQPQEEPKQ